MHLDGLGDIRQYHRFHILFALLKERLLLFDNTAADAQQRIISAFQTFDQPAGLLQVSAQVLGIVPGRGGDQGLVMVIDTQTWAAAWSKANAPAATLMNGKGIGHDEFG